MAGMGARVGATRLESAPRPDPPPVRLQARLPLPPLHDTRPSTGVDAPPAPPRGLRRDSRDRFPRPHPRHRRPRGAAVVCQDPAVQTQSSEEMNCLTEEMNSEDEALLTWEMEGQD